MAGTTAGPSDFEVPEDVKAAGFQNCAADESGSIVEGHDVKRTRSHRGVEGAAHKLSTSVTNGTSTFTGSLKERILIYVSWFTVYAIAFVAMVGKVCPKFASDLILLVARILILVFVTPEIVMHVSDLYAKENEIGVKATSNSDGLLNTGCSLDTNESSLTGGSKSGSPLILSERKTRDRIMQDASHRGVEGTADKFSTLVINFISTCMGLPKERVRIYLCWFALCATAFVAMVEKVCPKFANDVTLFVGFILYLVFVMPKIRMHMIDYAEENNVGVQVTRNDNGLLNAGSSLDTCKSSLTGESRRLLIACPSDKFIRRLVHKLNFGCLDKQKQAARKIRLLTKNKSENRVRIADAGAIKPLINLISSSDPQAQRYGVTAILNLSICDQNRERIVVDGAIEPLVSALETGTAKAKANAACTLFLLSEGKGSQGQFVNKLRIGSSGAIPPLVNLLKSGGSQRKKDASMALYSLCSENENKVRAVQAGAMRLLVELLHKGTPRQKEFAAGVLLQLCKDNGKYRTEVGLAGATPPLMALAQSRANHGNEKAKKLLKLLGQSSSGNAAARTSMPSA